jgi:hypothetical protein
MDVPKSSGAVVAEGILTRGVPSGKPVAAQKHRSYRHMVRKPDRIALFSK